jgi:outer membrane protein OmpA-like peptidoglycan-associated protein
VTYCTKCGNQLAPGARFCPKCGAAVSASAQPAVPAPVVLPQASAPPQKRSGLPVLLIILAVLGFIVVAGVGSVVYVGYKVKEKVTSVAQEVAHPAPSPGENKEASPAQNDNNDVGTMLGNLGNMLGGGTDEGDPVESISDKDPVTPCPAASFPPQNAARIPLLPGTVVTHAWGMKNGDVESRMSVASTDPTSVSFSASTGEYKDDDGHDWKGSGSLHTVCNEDFATANNYATVTGTSQPHIVHGLTRLRLSDKSFQEVKSSGKTNLIYWDAVSMGDAVKPDREGGLLTRVEPEDVAYPMIVNDERVNLATIHLAGIMDSVGKDPRPKKERPAHTAADVYVIDDPLNPLVLMLKLKDPVLHEGKFRIEVVKIEYKVAKPVNLVEKQLTEQKRAVTYGIYFDFNKDTIKPESEPVLKEIVQAMTDNPDWKLTVEGNTDNIGGDAYNLDLSKRRAAAVKETLVARYHIAPDRLSTNGFGASHPIETNDTLEGRARNRRVELTRE